MNVEQDLTSNKAALLEAIDSIFIEGGQSAVVDAVYLSAERLIEDKQRKADLRRRVIIMVTDGEDRVSFYKQKDLFQLLASSDVQVFTIGLTKEVKPENRNKAIELLKKLSGETGGRAFFPGSPAEIQRVSSDIINDIRTQYVIGYEPTGGDTGKDFHKVQVAISEDPNKEKRVAITRVGYQSRRK